MKNFAANKYLLIGIRYIIGFIFIFAGIEKIADPENFAVAISNYKIFPIFSINLIAVTIPWLEVTMGILILFNVWVKENVIVIITLLLLFNILVFSAILRDLDIDCGCFGTRFVNKAGYQKIGENFILIFLSYLIFRFSNGNEQNTLPDENR